VREKPEVVPAAGRQPHEHHAAARACRPAAGTTGTQYPRVDEAPRECCFLWHSTAGGQASPHRQVPWPSSSCRMPWIDGLPSHPLCRGILPGTAPNKKGGALRAPPSMEQTQAWISRSTRPHAGGTPIPPGSVHRPATAVHVPPQWLLPPGPRSAAWPGPSAPPSG